MFLPGESQGRGSLVGCHLWGRTESDTTEVTQQQQQQHTFRNNSKINKIISITPNLSFQKETVKIMQTYALFQKNIKHVHGYSYSIKGVQKLALYHLISCFYAQYCNNIVMTLHVTENVTLMSNISWYKYNCICSTISLKLATESIHIFFYVHIFPRRVMYFYPLYFCYVW